MTQKQRQTPIRPSQRRQLSRRQREWRQARTAIIIGIVAVLVVLAIPAYGYYATFVAPPRTWVVKVNESTFTLGYLVKLLRMYQRGSEALGQQVNMGTMPFQFINTITENELVRQAAPRIGITVSDEELDAEVRDRIVGPPKEGQQVSKEQMDREFREAFRNHLNQLQVSEATYRGIVRDDLLRDKLREQLGQDVPTVLPQIHLYRILVDTQEKANEVKIQFQRGTPFEKLVDQFSIDSEDVRKGGEVGWVPPGVIPQVDDTIFKLELNTLSEPIQETSPDQTGATTFTIYMVKERSDAREVSKEHRETLKSIALAQWLSEERRSNDVKTNFDSDKYEWVVKQLRISSQATPQAGS